MAPLGAAPIPCAAFRRRPHCAQCAQRTARPFARWPLDQIARPAFWQALQSETRAEDRASSAENVKAQRSYGAMPLIVLTAANDNGEPLPLPPAQAKAVERAWNAGHDRMARRSTVGVNFLVHGSGHFIQDDRPSVVISAIAEVLSQAHMQH